MGDEQQPDDARLPEGLPRSPTGRVPKWVIEEAQGRVPGSPTPQTMSTPAVSQVRALPPDVPPSRPPAAPKGGGRRAPGVGRTGSAWLSRLPAIVTVAVVAAVVAWTVTHGGFAGIGQPSSTVTAMANTPSPGREEADHPLGTPAPVEKSAASYRFASTQSDASTPVAYDPCRPVHYVVRTDGAPEGGRALIIEAVNRVSRATGLRFHDDGSTTEAPSRQRESYQRSRYGDRWAPVLIAWVTPKENPDFATDVAGEAGSARVTFPGRPTVYVTGQVELDAAKLSAMLAQPGGRGLVRAVIQHELGHLVGLGHVDDATQLMYPTTGAVTDYAAGDLTGLAALGRGACVPAV